MFDKVIKKLSIKTAFIIFLFQILHITKARANFMQYNIKL